MVGQQWVRPQFFALLHGDWKLQTAKRREKTWLFNLKEDPGELSNVAEASSAELQKLMAELKAIDAEQAKPLWPSLIEAPVLLDGHLDGSYDKIDEYVYWAN